MVKELQFILIVHMLHFRGSNKMEKHFNAFEVC